MTNAQVAALLRRLGILLELDLQPRSRNRALRTAAEAVEAHPSTLTPEDLLTLDLGDDARELLHELLQTGAIALYDALLQRFPSGMIDLVEVNGIGVTKALNLREQLQVDSLEDLLQAGREGRLVEVKGIGPKSAAQILQAAQDLIDARAAAAHAPTPEPEPTPLHDAIAEFMEEERARHKPDADTDQHDPQTADLADAPSAPVADAALRAAQLLLDLDSGSFDTPTAQEARPTPEPAPAEPQAIEPEPRPEPPAAAPEPTPAPQPASAHAPRHEPALRCPACRHEGLDADGTSALCPRCGRRLLCEDNILDAVGHRPQERTLFQRLMEFAPYADIYERFSRPAFTLALARRGAAAEIASALAALAPRPGEHILDVACGTGNFSRAIAERTEDHPRSRVIGVDLSWPMLRQAERLARRSGLDHLTFVRGDATRLPWADASFDAAHCAGALHLIPEPQRALAELARVLKPGGRVVIGTFVRSRNPLLRLPEALTGRLAGMTWFSVRDLTQHLEDAGFQHVEHRTSAQAVTLKATRRQP